MKIEEFARQIKAKKRELDDLFQRQMPVMVGRMAKDHYQDNFRKGGFVNNGLKKWKPAQRINSQSNLAGAHYGTLLSSRNHLFSSTSYSPGSGRVRIYNDAPHAPVHQFGQTLRPTVTVRIRRYAWARYYRPAGCQKCRKREEKGP